MTSLITAWLVDIDGTLALRGSRDPHDAAAAGEDRPNAAVVLAVQALAGHTAVDAIVGITGRHESQRHMTLSWLDAQAIPCDRLYMRVDGDFRADDVVKEEIYRRDIAHRYNIVGVLDDRDRVVEMWRRLGLVCFQVADGDF